VSEKHSCRHCEALDRIEQYEQLKHCALCGLSSIEMGKLKSQLKRRDEVLAWYADEKNWNKLTPEHAPAVDFDAGRMARSVLNDKA
jgi:hypothetical protein